MAMKADVSLLDYLVQVRIVSASSATKAAEKIKRHGPEVEVYLFDRLSDYTAEVVLTIYRMVQNKKLSVDVAGPLMRTAFDCPDIWTDLLTQLPRWQPSLDELLVKAGLISPKRFLDLLFKSVILDKKLEVVLLNSGLVHASIMRKAMHLHAAVREGTVSCDAASTILRRTARLHDERTTRERESA